MLNLFLGFFLFAMYILFTWNFELSNLIFGLVLAGTISLLYRTDLKSANIRNTPSAVWALIRYSGILFVDLIKSGFQVARILLSEKLPIEPGIIAITTGCESELSNALSAHSTTLTPGEIVVEMDEHGTMYTHVLNVSSADEYLREAQRIRRELLREIFP